MSEDNTIRKSFEGLCLGGMSLFGRCWTSVGNVVFIFDRKVK